MAAHDYSALSISMTILTSNTSSLLSLSLSLFYSRAQRYSEFIAWYAGEEGIEKVPGQGLPTLARTVLAEQWERYVLLSHMMVMMTVAMMSILTFCNLFSASWLFLYIL